MATNQNGGRVSNVLDIKQIYTIHSILVTFNFSHILNSKRTVYRKYLNFL